MLGFRRIDVKGLGKIFYYNDAFISSQKKSLVNFISDKPYMNRYDFARKMILSLEVKTNNAVEGKFDDFSFIEQIIKSKSHSTEIERRILNLYRGYQYILENKPINQNSLHELYKILSKDVLDDFSLSHMGKFYRERDVYILQDGFAFDFDRGLPVDKIETVMSDLLGYINENEELSPIDYFIKSQIIHYLFVYIHPYFDVNGRTSRTLAMWYLLNNNAYPYIIFNRAISLSKNEYLKNIRKSRNGNLTYYLSYILRTVHLELEKEFIITNLIKSLDNITNSDLEILEFILSLDESTLERLYNFYILYNKYMSMDDFMNEKIKPLVKMGIINPRRLKEGKLSIRKEALKIPKEKILELKYVRI